MWSCKNIFLDEKTKTKGGSWEQSILSETQPISGLVCLKSSWEFSVIILPRNSAELWADFIAFHGIYPLSGYCLIRNYLAFLLQSFSKVSTFISIFKASWKHVHPLSDLLGKLCCHCVIVIFWNKMYFAISPILDNGNHTCVSVWGQTHAHKPQLSWHSEG